MTKADLGKTLTLWRTSAGLSQLEVCGSFSRKITRQHLSGWERGVQLPFGSDVREFGLACRAPVGEVEKWAQWVTEQRANPKSRGSDGQATREAPVDGA